MMDCHNINGPFCQNMVTTEKHTTMRHHTQTKLYHNQGCATIWWCYIIWFPWHPHKLIHCAMHEPSSTVIAATHAWLNQKTAIMAMMCDSLTHSVTPKVLYEVHWCYCVSYLPTTCPFCDILVRTRTAWPEATPSMLPATDSQQFRASASVTATLCLCLSLSTNAAMLLPAPYTPVAMAPAADAAISGAATVVHNAAILTPIPPTCTFHLSHLN